MKIILTDLEFRKSFDIFHILKSRENEIIGFSSENSFHRFILSIIYRQKIHKYDNYKKLDAPKLVYFPCEEDSTLHFYESANNILALLPSKETFKLVRDKKVFSEFCLKENLPVPMEYNFNDLLKQKQLPCPLIIKPKIGSGSIGIKFIDTFEELDSCKNLNFDNYLIQERLENSRNIEGAFFLFDKGRPISYYGHKRIRTYPVSGGVTVYSECVINSELKELGEMILSKLNWSGIAMVEFLYDQKSKSYKIIEINPRAWGSIMLSEFCGSNILQNYINLATNRPLLESNIKKDRYIRWFLPWDLLSYFQQKGNIKNFWQFDTKKCCYINFSYAPKISAIIFTLYNIFNPKKITKFFTKVFG